MTANAWLVPDFFAEFQPTMACQRITPLAGSVEKKNGLPLAHPQTFCLTLRSEKAYDFRGKEELLKDLGPKGHQEPGNLS
jgi:hypothetical protein